MSNVSESASNPTQPNFEDALRQIQEIVADLEEGNVGLEDSLLRFEQGIGLLRHCYQFLDRIDQRIELLIGVDASGVPLTVPFDAAATANQTSVNDAKPVRRRAAPRKPKGDADNSASAAETETGPHPDELLF